ncbi:acylaminoacyl-peptidase [Flavobacterium noncentrifugens]|uniref:Dipeptidyl aminopeptidase/acylaminoacyl peptidase n=1 Tax=Flavobacterium noncentrifugens TaxID=1128970 RepID=A0A1G8SI47_9FLAO|nr:prolyl oligopeptidase family serine peptidase [Flavobacterium noncentrifugens]GEP49840.1 acylaminoacyl-peptidase [Flavobacterium noncentrifugens]SDJ28867.1 Dipeptidyl aminopeptidase/acylaminoacyl peptidase [Flavobacterium noncentrifugens]
MQVIEIRPLRLVLYVLVLAAAAANGQNKKRITEKDYALWSTLASPAISGNGNWASYHLQYESGKDTLFLKAKKGKRAYAYAAGRNESFNTEKGFACLKNDTLILRNLKSANERIVAGVSEYAFSGNGKYVMMLKGKEGNAILEVNDMQGKTVYSLANVYSWHASADRNALLCSLKNGDQFKVMLIGLGNLISGKTIAASPDGLFANLTFSKDGSAFAFSQHTAAENRLWFYDGAMPAKVFSPSGREDFPKDLSIAAQVYDRLYISDDHSKVFFYMAEPKKQANPGDAIVEIWNTADRRIYPKVKRFGDGTLGNKLAFWQPQSGRFIQLTDKQFPNGSVLPGQYYAVLYDRFRYEPQFEAFGPRDLWLVDLETGSKKLVAEKLGGGNRDIALSPGGKYITYAKDANWWVYDIATETHVNITKDLGMPVCDTDNDQPDKPDLYGNPGWTENDKSVLVYDKFDVWEISPNGKTSRRLTRGREQRIRFRIEPLDETQKFSTDGIDYSNGIFDLKKGLVLQAHNHYTSYNGYFRSDEKAGEKPLVWEHSRIDNFMPSASGNAFAYMSERFDSAPKLAVGNYGTIKTTTVVQSNPQQKDYYWGTARQISYAVNGKKLSGVLFYPADYKPGIKYPMVVHIYQQQLRYIHDYENPSMHIRDGFNVTNLVNAGYFVLYPDIVYEAGKTGQSATDCVLAAVDEVVSQGAVDPKKIALQGHSFGGYQTYYILTHTNRFACGVAGSGWTDLLSLYLSVSKNYQDTEYFRMEHDQIRMGKTLFEDPARYLENSPVVYADKLETPLLSWTGEKDGQISALQSIEFHLALRRLQKPSTLLVYTGQDHSLELKESRYDLNRKMLEWFGHYLKGEKAPDWLRNVE